MTKQPTQQHMQQAVTNLKNREVAAVFTCEELYYMGLIMQKIQGTANGNETNARLAGSIFAVCDTILKPLLAEELRLLVAAEEADSAGGV